MKTILYNAFLVSVLMLMWAGIIYAWQWHEDMREWGEKPIVEGPADWKEKQADCERRAKLLGGAWIEFVNDERYCVVHL